MEKIKYYTPDISDIRIGYQCQSTNNGKDWYDWEFKEHNFGSLSLELLNSMYRTSYLTLEDIEREGFEKYAHSIDDWFKLKDELRFDTDLQNFSGYKPYNIFLNYGFHDYRLHIKADFSGGADYSDSEMLYDGECKSINELKQILKQIHIIPFYEG